MDASSVAFIGGGRITRIILEGWKKKNHSPSRICVSDTDADILRGLQWKFPEIEIHPGENIAAVLRDIIFLAVHPPAIAGILAEIKDVLRPTSIVISLAPKWTIKDLSAGLGGYNRIVRMIPNAASIINEGFNPISFSGAFTEAEKEEITQFLLALGDCPKVDERKLEAYAILTAMGPTYFWPQLDELKNLGESFGLTTHEIAEGMVKMMEGAVKTLYASEMSFADVMNLIPVKPLGEEEHMIREIYRTKLNGLYKKLKG
jgi:pyrroline-5-carboxylate reductase